MPGRCESAHDCELSFIFVLPLAVQLLACVRGDEQRKR